MPGKTPRATEVRRQFVSRVRPEQRTAEAVTRFYKWLAANCPELLSAGKNGEPLEQLRKDLKGLYK